MKLKRRAIVWALVSTMVAAWTASSAPQPASAQGRALEFSVKAAFLTKFAAFVSWPAGAAVASQPLTICVVGDDALGAALAQAAQGGHSPSMRRMDVITSGTDCRIVYAAGSARQSVGDILTAVRGAPVLTITDAARGPARGIIHFVVFEDRVRFHVDTRQAAQSGLGISSKLLAVALSVKR